MFVVKMWLSSVSLVQLLTLLLVIPATGVYQVCISRKSPKSFGVYPKILTLFSFQSVCFSGISCALGLNYYSNSNSVSVFSTRNLLGLPKSGMTILTVMGASWVCMMFCTLAIQLLYRMFAMSKSENLRYFEGKKLLIWVMGIMLVTTIFGGTTYIAGPMMEDSRADNFSATIRQTFGMSPTDELHFARIRLHSNESLLPSIGFYILFIMINIQFFLIFAIGIRTARLSFKTTHLLSNHRQLHGDLTNALITRMIVLEFLIYVPMLQLFMMPVCGWDVGVWTDLCGLTFVIYPLLEPLMMIYFIKPYREYIYKGGFLKKHTATVNVAVVGGSHGGMNGMGGAHYQSIMFPDEESSV